MQVGPHEEMPSMAGARGLGTERRPTAFVESWTAFGSGLRNPDGVWSAAVRPRCTMLDLNRFVTALRFLFLDDAIGNCSWAE